MSPFAICSSPSLSAPPWSSAANESTNPIFVFLQTFVRAFLFCTGWIFFSITKVVKGISHLRLKN